MVISFAFNLWDIPRISKYYSIEFFHHLQNSDRYIHFFFREAIALFDPDKVIAFHPVGEGSNPTQEI
jgi:hypothetical protein